MAGGVSRRGFLAACGAAACGAYGDAAAGRAEDLVIAHCSDPQFGMGYPRAGREITEEGYRQDLARLEAAIGVINGLAPDLVCFTGDMTHRAEDVTRDWPRLLKLFRMPVVVAPGNHDMGNRLTAANAERFISVFGAEYRSVLLKGWRIIVGNSQYWHPTDETARRDAYRRWLADEFAAAVRKGEKVILAAHIPPFVRAADEKDGYGNCPLADRAARLAAYRAAGARFFLAGHTHATLERRHGPLVILNSETTCLNFDNRPFGFRLLRIRPDASYDWDFVPVAPGQAQPRQLFTLMSFNICHGEGMDGRVDLARTAAVIAKERPRFAGLCELDCRTTRTGGVDQPQELARLTGMQATFAPAIDFAGGKYGVALLSREPPLASTQIPLPGAEPRTLLLAEFPDCFVGVTHLSVAADAERVASVALIRAALDRRKSWAAEQKNKPVFLMGDWNTRPQSDVLTSLRGFLTVLSDETGRTFHGRTTQAPPLDQDFCIDYIAVDSGHAADWRVTARRTIPDEITSDHKPIVVTVASTH